MAVHYYTTVKLIKVPFKEWKICKSLIPIVLRDNESPAILQQAYSTSGETSDFHTLVPQNVSLKEGFVSYGIDLRVILYILWLWNNSSIEKKRQLLCTYSTLLISVVHTILNIHLGLLNFSWQSCTVILLPTGPESSSLLAKKNCALVAQILFLIC